jgi:hypothetical protein
MTYYTGRKWQAFVVRKTAQTSALRVKILKRHSLLLFDEAKNQIGEDGDDILLGYRHFN